jgi:hypothetical protein
MVLLNGNSDIFGLELDDDVEIEDDDELEDDVLIEDVLIELEELVPD